MFADKVEINVHAGRGGDGLLSFRHEKYRAKGGPDGGDGGRGGSVIFQVDHNQNTLSAYRTKRLLKAGEGQSGKTNRSHGKNGEDVTVKVPQGTMIFEDGQLLADLASDGQTVVIARGGRGGFGNAHFTSSTRQAPRAAELGAPGEHKQLTLELKMVADVGLVGLPNAGKSTLLSVISNAKPEIGDYPFTTLIPNLGVVDFEDYTFLVADIPGLIEGASQGKGLGDEFLRHVERTAVLLHLIDAHSEDVAKSYLTIQKELKEYAVDLSSKPQIIVLTKTEHLPEGSPASKQETSLVAALASVQEDTAPIVTISAQAHKGLDDLLHEVVDYVKVARQKRAEEEQEAAIPVIDEASQPELWQVQKEGEGFRVEGTNIEGFAQRTDWNNDASVERLRDILRKQGVARELVRKGVEAGDKVQIGDHELEWL